MKKLLTLLLMSVVLLSGCYYGGDSIRGSGKMTTVDYDYSGFTGVSAGYSFEVSIEHSSDYSVEITCDENIVEYLAVDLSGDTLRLGLEDIHAFKNVNLKAKVTMPDIRSIETFGASDIEIAEGFSFDHDLEVDLSGASSLKGKLDSGDLTMDLSGASDAALDGSGKNLECDLSGSSEVNLLDYPVVDANVRLSGASTANINSTGKIKINASGASSLKYKGGGVIDEVELSGSSEIEKID